MSNETVVRLLGGKYELRHENGRNFRALRYGEPWRDLTGDGMVLALVQRIEELEGAAQQGQGEAGLLPPSITLPSLIEAARCLGCAQEKGDADAIRYWNGQIEHYAAVASRTAPPAQPAERGVEGWRVLQIGAVGSAYDPPNTRRAFTYGHQPGNESAWALGKASSAAAKASAGDYIDGGLNLLKALQEQGFGVFQIEPPASPVPSPARGDGGRYDVIDTEDGRTVAEHVSRNDADRVISERWQDKLVALPLYRAKFTQEKNDVLP